MWRSIQRFLIERALPAALVIGGFIALAFWNEHQKEVGPDRIEAKVTSLGAVLALDGLTAERMGAHKLPEDFIATDMKFGPSGEVFAFTDRSLHRLNGGVPQDMRVKDDCDAADAARQCWSGDRERSDIILRSRLAKGAAPEWSDACGIDSRGDRRCGLTAISEIPGERNALLGLADGGLHKIEPNIDGSANVTSFARYFSNAPAISIGVANMNSYAVVSGQGEVGVFNAAAPGRAYFLTPQPHNGQPCRPLSAMPDGRGQALVVSCGERGGFYRYNRNASGGFTLSMIHGCGATYAMRSVLNGAYVIMTGAAVYSFDTDRAQCFGAGFLALEAASIRGRPVLLVLDRNGNLVLYDLAQALAQDAQRNAGRLASASLPDLGSNQISFGDIRIANGDVLVLAGNRTLYRTYRLRDGATPLLD